MIIVEKIKKVWAYISDDHFINTGLKKVSLFAWHVTFYWSALARDTWPVTCDECVTWVIIILILSIQNSGQVSPYTLIILSPQLWPWWIKSKNIFLCKNWQNVRLRYYCGFPSDILTKEDTKDGLIYLFTCLEEDKVQFFK